MHTNENLAPSSYSTTEETNYSKGTPSTLNGKIVNQEDWKNLDGMTKVYLMGQYDNLYKIGYCSTSIKSRLIPLQGNNPHTVECIFAVAFSKKEDAVKYEKLFHERYSKFSIGREWFLFSKTEAALCIEELRKLNENYTTKVRDLPCFSTNILQNVKG